VTTTTPPAWGPQRPVRPYTRAVDVVLVHPQIPHNSGCAGRLTAAVGARLHLVEPLGFSLEDRYLKRAGLDYWPLVDLVVHADLDTCLASLSGERPLAARLKLFTARGGTSLFEAEFAPDDVLVFGSESEGLPADLLARPGLEHVYVPIRPGVRSLNLANTVGLGLYTAMHRAGVALPDNDGAYEPHPDAAEDVWPHQVARRSAGAQDGQPGTGG
jgi:tRNA (cytidine/uridine-2'-O-)-methyltransferase